MPLHAPRALRRLAAAAALGLCLAPAAAHAGPNANARIALHVTALTNKNACAWTNSHPACSGVVTQGGLAPTYHYVYLLVMKGNPSAGLAGLQCGLQYNNLANAGVDIFGWTLCATLEFASTGWPNSGGGDLITWERTTRCQRSEPGGPGTGVVATAGYFYVGAYTPDILRVIPRPVDGAAKVADCNSNEDVLEGAGIVHTPSFLGSAQFSSGAGQPGYNPCTASDNPPPDCAISGPTSVTPGTLVSYSAPGAPVGATFLWGVTGNGTISGSATGSSVAVQVGAAAGGDQLDLALDVTNAGITSHCTLHVVVDAPPPFDCAIQGADPVVEGATGLVYSLSVNRTVQSYAWSISGNGTITSALNGTTATVTAGATGAFTLTAHLTASSGEQTTCLRVITVNPPACGITGPDPVVEFAQALTYTATSPSPASTYLWEVSGNASIAGSAVNAGVVVNAGASGAFTLYLTQTSGGNSQRCSRVITINRSSGGGHQNANAKLLVHLLPVTTKNACDRGSVTCINVVTTGQLYPARYFAYLIAVEGSAPAGFGGLQCGIDYQAATASGVDVFGWTLCASLEFPSAGAAGPWPAAGSGNLVTWDALHCQRNEPGGPGTGVVATAGYFYLAAYSADTFGLTPRPIDNQAKVADCGGGEDIIGGTGFPGGVPSRLGTVRFGGGSGYNPCGSINPVQPTTWSQIKGLFAKP